MAIAFSTDFNEKIIFYLIIELPSYADAQAQSR